MTGALHDVSNALTVVLGWVVEAREGRVAPEQLDRAFAIIEDRARAARDLARRAIGACSDDDIEERDEALDAVIGDVVEALSVEAHRARVTFVVKRRCPGVRVPFAADASQVLTNVLLNALAWAPAGSAVTVDPAADAVSATVMVSDQGPGVAPAQAAQVFEGSSTREGGAGLGLKHARALTRAAGGELELVAAGAAPGARFLLRWPRLEPASFPAPPPSAPRPAVLAGTRVLVVEDDVDVATLLEAALGARGAEVVVARTAAELVAHAGGHHDAALVDLSPIAADVRGALDALHRGSPGAALVFISGSAAGLPEGLEGEGIRWIRKPFEVGEIVEALVETRALAVAAAKRSAAR